MIVEPTADAIEGRSSSAVASVRHLPYTALVSPRDGAELRSMLAWSLTQSDPVVIWLPQPFEPPTAGRQATEIQLARSECITTGEDVALVAWGPLVSAATMAAENLAGYGIKTTVIDARFAQPLDVGGIARAVPIRSVPSSSMMELGRTALAISSSTACCAKGSRSLCRS